MLFTLIRGGNERDENYISVEVTDKETLEVLGGAGFLPSGPRKPVVIEGVVEDDGEADPETIPYA